MNQFFERLSSFHKKIIASSLDIIFALIALPLAFFLRYGQAFPQIFESHQVLFQALLLVSIQSICFHSYGMYRSIWRYSSTPDLIRLIKAVSFSSLLSFVAIFLYNRLENTPRSIFIINWLLLVIGLGGWRLFYRITRDYFLAYSSKTFERVIVIGAGSGGEQLVREVNRTPSLNMKVVGFVDDDRGTKNKLLHGIPILGTIDDLEKVLKKTGANSVFIAIPSATGVQMKRFVDACRSQNVQFKTLPPMKDIINGLVSIEQLRNVEPEDLLGREPIELDKESIQKMIKGCRVMVTGAGGSIGSEICRQVAQYSPKEIILFEQTELSLYNLDFEFRQKYPSIDYHCIIGDVRSNEDLDSVFEKYRPEVVFHAAAYKHVPMMENNPKSAIKTNVFGTYRLAKKSIEYAVKKIVIISTDKAVNPTNVMGATKRLAEVICQNLQANSKTQFVVVRFGNVLGSSGSVIPLFKKQLLSGGPITITHPDIERYFMSISEATQLVLQAGALGNKSEIFVLNMGKPVKIVDLAKQLISLSGISNDQEIEILYTGLRPGEKLYEELLFDDEKTIPTLHPMLRVAKARSENSDINVMLEHLNESLNSKSIDYIKEVLAKLVPEYRPELENESGEVDKKNNVVAIF
jgi:FlaA1/EpsC-like NDP-sugar epimerase